MKELRNAVELDVMFGFTYICCCDLCMATSLK